MCVCVCVSIKVSGSNHQGDALMQFHSSVSPAAMRFAFKTVSLSHLAGNSISGGITLCELCRTASFVFDSTR